MPCRINRKRLWAARLTLESMLWESSVFLTLTYSPELYPEDGCVSKRELQLFLKRLRKLLPQPIRYYGVGEYGDLSKRAHYHLILFNVYPGNAPDIDKAWGKGLIHVGSFTIESAAYVAGYITNARTNQKDLDYAGMPEKTPEFSIMSRRPGIGADAVLSMAGKLGSNNFLRFGTGEHDRDVPAQYRLGNKKYPLGRYLSRKLREALAFPDLGEPEHKRRERLETLISENLRTTTEYLAMDRKARKAHNYTAVQRSKFSTLKGKI